LTPENMSEGQKVFWSHWKCHILSFKTVVG